jgi:hypothetical protein
VALSAGAASTSLATLPRGANTIAAEYSGDLLNLASTNSLVQTVTNHPPVAGATYTMNVSLGVASTVPVVGKYAPTDQDGDALTVTGVSGNANGTLTFTATNLTYTATNGTTDSFSYTVSDGNGGTVDQTVNVAISTPPSTAPNQLNLQMAGGNVVLSYAGIPGFNYALEGTPSMTPPVVWTSIVTNTAAGNGSLTYTVPVSDGYNFFRTRYAP